MVKRILNQNMMVFLLNNGTAALMVPALTFVGYGVMEGFRENPDYKEENVALEKPSCIHVPKRPYLPLFSLIIVT
mgnify:CR=1 FL=1